jgi:hypothetical protein
VQQRLHVLDRCGERQRGDGRAVVVERQYVIAARRAVSEDEDLALPFGAKVNQVVSRVPLETGQIEVPRLELVVAPLIDIGLSS